MFDGLILMLLLMSCTVLSFFVVFVYIRWMWIENGRLKRIGQRAWFIFWHEFLGGGM